MSLTDGGRPGERAEYLVEAVIDCMNRWPEGTVIERSLDVARLRFAPATAALRLPMRLRRTR